MAKILVWLDEESRILLNYAKGKILNRTPSIKKITNAEVIKQALKNFIGDKSGRKSGKKSI